MSFQWTIYFRRLFLVVAVSSACTDGEPTALGTTVSPQLVASATGSRIRTIDDAMSELVNDVPGFGGLYVDTDNRLHVFLTDTSTRQASVTAIGQFVDAHGGQSARLLQAMVVHKARYDFRQLSQWHVAVSGRVNQKGITQTAIDKSANRLEIGVLDNSTLARVRGELGVAGVPSEAAAVRIISPTNITTTLRDFSRPVRGGLQVQLGGGFCTLGFNAYSRFFYDTDSSSAYFVTNSHCTDSFGSSTGQQAGQPDLNNLIGYEVADPPLITNASDSRCPVGRNCRFSDAALFQYYDGVSREHATIEKLSSGLTISGYYTINDANRNASFFPNETMMKVGRTTGFSSALIGNQCVTVAQFANGVDTGRTMVCQAQANYSSGPGDSGSPVFSSSYPGGDFVKVHGIHWGSNGTTASFSILSDVEAELKYFFTFPYSLWVY